MHAETLRAKLRGVEGESVSVEIADMLTEWMQEKNQPHATAWIEALASDHALVAIPVEAGIGNQAQNHLVHLLEKSLDIDAQGGRLSSMLLDSLRDRAIAKGEADQIAAQIDQEMRLLAKLRRNIMRIAETGGHLVVDENKHG